MLTLQEAAQKAGVSEKTLRRAIGSKSLVAHQRETRGHNNQPFMIDELDLDQWLASRQPAQIVAQTSVVDQPGLARLAELEITVRRLQDDQLLGGGRDLLALGPADDAYTQNRIDALEKRILALEARFEVIHEKLAELLVKQSNQAPQITPAQTPEQEETRAETPPEPTYEGEWTITGTNGQVVYHDSDPQRARRRLDSLIANYRTTKWQLHWPVFTPSSGTATEITTNLPNDVHKRIVLSTGEVIDFLQDFTVPGPHGYKCKATHKDVKAELTVLPYQYDGDYNLTQTTWGKISDVGREGPKQTKRAQYLLATLIDRTEGEMSKAGWVKSGMRDDITPSRPLWRKANV